MNHPTTIREALDNLADKVDLYRFGIEDGSIKPADAFEKKEQALNTALQDITRIVEEVIGEKQDLLITPYQDTFVRDQRTIGVNKLSKQQTK